jgi:hypothetical protein
VAIARCKKCGPPVGLKISYEHRHVLKDGHRFMCGAAACAQPAYYVWLRDAEQAEYLKGERLFGVRSRHGLVELR